jgi:hopanoid biosynthesis associated RND transporter like protein HpnN
LYSREQEATQAMSREQDFEAQDYRKRLIHRVQLAVVDAACRWPWLTLGVAGMLVCLSIWLACTRLTFLTQRGDLISPRKESQQRWQQYLAEFGDDDDLVVVVKGDDREEMKQALDKLALKLRAQPELFDRIFYKVDLRSLHDRALLFLPVEQIRQIQDGLQGMNLLLAPPFLEKLDPLFGWKSLNLSQLLGEAERRVFATPSGEPPRKQDRQFFTQLTSIAQIAAVTVQDPDNYVSPWTSILPDANGQEDLMAEPQYFFSGDGKLAFLLTRPTKDLSSFTSAEQSIARMREIISDLRGRYPNLGIGLTGLPVLENEEMVASQQDTQLASWLALAGVALLFVIVYRCVRYPLLTVTTLLVGTAWAFGWLTLTVGHLNILSATFAVMLIGLGDYGVLWVTRYEQERASGHDGPTAMRLTTLTVGPSILIAALTTALAFFSALLADFRAVAELGWIAGSGVLLCALACFTVLPPMLKLMDRKETAPKMTLRLASRTTWLPALNRRPRWLLAGATMLLVAGAVCAGRLSYDHNLLHLQASGLESVEWELTLIEHTAGATWHALSITSTPEEALALKARFERQPGVARVVEVASLVPREQELKLVLLKDIQNRLRGLPARGVTIPHLPPDPAQLSAKITNLLGGLQSFDGNDPDGMMYMLCQSLLRLRQQLDRPDSAVVAQHLQAFEQHMTRDLADDLHKLRDVSVPKSITTTDLPPSLRERFLGASGKWLLKIFGSRSLWEYPALEEFVKQIQKVDPDATGKPFSTLEGLKVMKEGFQWAAVYALLAMILLFLADFRNLWHTLLALAPLLSGVVLSFGLLGLFGLPLNPANMIALPLILGVGANYGVYLVHDFLSRRGQGSYALRFSTGRGIFVAALTNILGFGTLMISHHRGLFGLGLLLTIGVSCCMVTALVFLPALLSLVTRRAPPAEPTLPMPTKARAA